MSHSSRHRRHRRYKAVEARAAAEARPRGGGGQTHWRPVRRAGHLRGRHPAPSHRSFDAEGVNADIEHIALASTIDLLLIARDATSSVASPTARRRLSHHALHRHPGALLVAPAMTRRCSSTRWCGRTSISPRAARALSSRAKAPRVADGKGRWPNRTRLYAIVRFAAAARPARAGVRRSDLRRLLIPFASSATGRAAGWGCATRRKRRRGAAVTLVTASTAIADRRCAK